MQDFPYDKLPRIRLNKTLSRKFPDDYLVKLVPGHIVDEIRIYKIRSDHKLFRYQLANTYALQSMAAEAILQGIDLSGPDVLTILCEYAIQRHKDGVQKQIQNQKRQTEAENYFEHMR